VHAPAGTIDLKTWVGLLRGVNVGGRNSLPMKRLQEILGELGFKDAATYIQSGNCVFRSRISDAAKIQERIADAIAAEFSFRPAVFAISLDSLERAISGSPFSEDRLDPKSVHLFFLARPVGKPDETAMRSLAAPDDDFALVGKVFYLLTPAGIGRSKLVEKLGKFLAVDMTARNLRSAIKIAELGRSLGA
jgi:uncharacterized protein (DUF1697 family)